MQTLRQELLLIAMAASDVAAGRSLSVDDAARVAIAAGRVRSAIEDGTFPAFRRQFVANYQPHREAATAV